MSKYSENFKRDFNWYLSVRHQFNFDGHAERLITHDSKGIDGKRAFYLFDSQGVLKATKHPNLLRTLIRTKGSVNLHIKMYAEDRAKAILTGMEFTEMCKTLKSPSWFYKAVEIQKFGWYEKIGMPEWFMVEAREQLKELKAI
jgi:hypothetical protein